MASKKTAARKPAAKKAAAKKPAATRTLKTRFKELEKEVEKDISQQKKELAARKKAPAK